MEVIKALRQVLFLKTVRDEALSLLSVSGHALRLERGEPLFAEFERCRGMFVVLSGSVKVYKTDSRGRELTLSMQMPGASIGELPLFDGGNYPYNAEAAHANTEVWFVPRDKFLAVMRAYPEVAERALLALGIQLRQMIQIAEAQSLYSVRARLADYLLETASGRTQFRLEATNEVIGSRLGTVREVVSRTLRTLREAKVISLQGRWILLVDAEELRRIAGGD